MSSSEVVLTGTVISEVSATDFSGERAMTRFRLRVPNRRFDRTQGRMVEGAASTYTVVCWRSLAVNVGAAVRSGDAVIVAGRLRVRDWTSSDGRTGTVAEVNARTIGHDLNGGFPGTRERVSSILVESAGTEAGCPAA